MTQPGTGRRWPLLQLELRRLTRTRGVPATLLVSALLLLLSGAGALTVVDSDTRARETFAAAERARWLEQGRKDPHSAAHYSIWVTRQAAPLEALEPGITAFLGQTVWLEAHHQHDFAYRPGEGGSVVERLGAFDVAGLLLRLAPLVAVVIAFAAVSRERPDGTLALALATSSSRWRIVGSKTTAVVVLATAATVGPAVLVGVAGSLITGAMTIDTVLRLGSWAAMTAAYVALWSAAAVAAIVACRSSALALSGLLTAWMILVLAGVPAISAWADRRSPLPSYQQMRIGLENEAPAYWTAETGAALRTDILERYGVDDVDALTVNIRGVELDTMERRSQAAFARQIGGFFDRVVAQDDAYAGAAWVSPAVAFDVISMALAGTDFRQHRAFLDQAETYRRDLVNRMNADLMAHRPANGRAHTNDVALWSQIPAFAPIRPSIIDTLAALTPAILGLGLWLAVAAVSLVIATKRLGR